MNQPRVVPMIYGALPHTDVQAALDVVRQCAVAYVVWPQLPQRSFRERSIVQSLWGFPGVHIDEAQRRIYVERADAEAALDTLALDFLLRRDTRPVLSPAEAMGLFAVLPFMAGFDAAIGCKGQLLGPISLAVQVTDEQQNPLIASGPLFEAVVQHVCQRAAWQANLLGRTQRDVLICIDEPFLDVVNSPFLAIDREELLLGLARVLEAIPGRRALAIQSLVTVPGLVDLQSDVIFVNAHDIDQHFDIALPLIQRLWARGGSLGLGCVPADAGFEAYQQGYAVLQRLVERCAAQGVDLLGSGAQVFVMPVASLGQVGVDVAEATVQATCRLADEFNKRIQRSE
jgi:hypothetical protein